MKLNYVLLTAFLSLALGAVSCSNEMEVVDANISALSVKIKNQVASRAPITESTLPADDKGVGITLVNKSDKGKYDGQTGYDNTQWKTTDGTNWDIVGSTVPSLTGTEGVAVAYYPYSSTVTDYMAIPVESASQTDYMYSGWSNDLNNQAAEATFTMQHALAVVRVKLVASSNYTGDKSVSAVTISSDGFMATASLDASTGILSSKDGAGAEHTQDNLGLTLDATGKDVDFLVIPADASADINFIATIANKQYAATVTLGEALAQGLIHTYTLTISATGMKVSAMNVSPWDNGYEDNGELDPYNPWKNVANGVYAISAKGAPVMESKANSSCIGVALIVNDAPVPQRFMIAKKDAKNDSYTTLDWGPEGIDIVTLKNYYTVDAVNDTGYLHGTYTPILDRNYRNWTEGALSDFYGMSNTSFISAESSDARAMCTVLRDFNTNDNVNEGFSDWYVPACGQSGLIYLNITTINRILVAIGGTKLVDNYWTSTEEDDGHAYNIRYSSGHIKAYYGAVYGGKEGQPELVRFIRDL